MSKKILSWLLPFLAIMLFAFGFSLPSVTIYSIGDSTMASYPIPGDYPGRGWMQSMSKYATDDVKINNMAVSGTSSKSFRDKGYWQKVSPKLRPNDYVFIQFGHNDEKKDADRATEPKTTFKNNLKKYLQEVRDKGAIPILFTSIVRRKFNEQGKLIDTHGDYVEVVRELANSENVFLIDLNKSSEELVEKFGVEQSKTIFLHLKPGVYKKYPNGLEDNTHLSEFGSEEIAKLVIQELASKNHPLMEFFKEK